MAAWIVIIVGLGIPAYAYAGYPILLFLLASVVQVTRDVCYLLGRRERRTAWDELPSVTMIVAAYNEEDVIEAKVRNFLELEYPPDRFRLIVGSDGSKDRTLEIVAGFDDERVQLEAFGERRGKLAVLNDCVGRAECDILVFSDANTLLRPDALRKLVRHFRDPKIGAVCGELRLEGGGGETAYWRYEMVLKLLESKLDSTLGANGAIYAMRRSLYPFPPPWLITDDFVIPMTARAKGYTIRYDPEAVAREETAPSAGHEFRRRIRIGSGNFQALWFCRSLLLPWKGFVSFSFWSHKVARWFTPFLLAAALVANVLLVREPAGRVVFACQAAFYVMALLGWFLGRIGLRTRLFRIMWYFVLINAGLACGFFQWLLGRHKVTWRRTLRGAGEEPEEGGAASETEGAA